MLYTPHFVTNESTTLCYSNFKNNLGAKMLFEWFNEHEFHFKEHNDQIIQSRD